MSGISPTVWTDTYIFGLLFMNSPHQSCSPARDFFLSKSSLIYPYGTTINYTIIDDQLFMSKLCRFHERKKFRRGDVGGDFFAFRDSLLRGSSLS